MFTLLRLSIQFLLRKYSLSEKNGMRQFLIDLIATIKPLAASSETKIDDKLIEHLEYILANDNLYDYFYKIIKDQFSTDDIIFESIEEELIVDAMNDNASQENMPLGINPMLVINIISQLITIINQLKDTQDFNL